MTFTRKHFEAVADLLNANMADESIVLDFADMFEEDNERFRADLFVDRATKGIRLNAAGMAGRIDKAIARRVK